MTAAEAMETYATDNNGSYAAATVAALRAIEPTLNDANLTIPATTATSYAVEVTSTSSPSASFRITRSSNGTSTRTCSPPGVAGCPQSGTWGDGSQPPPPDPAAVAKSQVVTAAEAMETYATDNNGSYAAATVAALRAIEPTLNDANLTIPATTATSYAVEVTSTSSPSASFRITRSSNGTSTRTCSPPGVAGCPQSGAW